jgi:hypothetical protein
MAPDSTLTFALLVKTVNVSKFALTVTLAGLVTLSISTVLKPAVVERGDSCKVAADNTRVLVITVLVPEIIVTGVLASTFILGIVELLKFKVVPPLTFVVPLTSTLFKMTLTTPLLIVKSPFMTKFLRVTAPPAKLTVTFPVTVSTPLDGPNAAESTIWFPAIVLPPPPSSALAVIRKSSAVTAWALVIVSLGLKVLSSNPRNTLCLVVAPT